MSNYPFTSLPSKTVGQIPELKYGAPATLSEQIADWLRVRILAGEFKPDEERIPSEKELTEIFDVSRPTARRAIQILRREGLVYTLPQRGTYVNAVALRERWKHRRGRAGLSIVDVIAGTVWGWESVGHGTWLINHLQFLVAPH
jgi:DNA-binding transcriptional regulator YhcF (GntR family)